MFNCIYDIFLTCEKNNCNDLVVNALPMFLADAKNKTRKYVSDDTDISFWSEYANELYDQQKNVAKFIGRHYKVLVNAFEAHDRESFDSVVEECIKSDIEDAKKDGDSNGDND